ncbi:MAG: DUF1800 domain-containing protein [Piscinibacter sp.]|nr:DUF1800 domain-containing protein [Piscinibacter sp.]
MAVRRAWVAAAAALLLTTGCGGSKEDEVTEVTTPPTSSEAARFLTQATFGPTDTEVQRVMSMGYSAWIDAQFNRPATSHRTFWETQDAAVKAANANNSIGSDGVYNSFWRQALTGEDQLRQRVAYALSQIFVISLQDGTVGENPRAVAAYLDMLGEKGFGNYRDLLEAVSRHPMMGVYLTHLRNRKADARTGRVPDENYAREVMQLFSIGLARLNMDGTPQLSNGAPIDTYGQSDIAGLAKVFTGFSWACPDWPDNGCFNNGSLNNVSDPDRTFKPMLGYPQYHSTEEKSFLGTTIPAQAQANPDASLATALDALANHPNVGPFIGKQLIQRLVTSNPSPAYVSAVAQTFANNGNGVRGDMKAVIKKVLTHPEARQVSSTSGKLREPVLRLSAVLRAFGYASDSGNYRVGNTDNAGSSLGQTPMRSPSVFNFYRPGYVPPGTQAAAAGLVAPEMALAQETTAAGYVNYMRDNIASGVGASGTVVINGANVTRRDLQPNFAAEIALATQPVDLVERLNTKLMYGSMPEALKTEIATAVGTITIPALNSGGTNQSQIDTAKRNRVNAAVFLTVVSPEFQVQK